MRTTKPPKAADCQTRRTRFLVEPRLFTKGGVRPGPNFFLDFFSGCWTVTLKLVSSKAVSKREVREP
jgi:hypothetical protein